jgi:hypothetical protein
MLLLYYRLVLLQQLRFYGVDIFAVDTRYLVTTTSVALLLGACRPLLNNKQMVLRH